MHIRLLCIYKFTFITRRTLLYICVPTGEKTTNDTNYSAVLRILAFNFAIEFQLNNC